ncbi:helix-turn-helix domain-containing protein [Streptococcus himalayensis]|uniref:Transcriptional regulator n=1 Tax=Streptococcus himalayensis TaxID=1888195 RepID=A0A917A3Q9_9STRE|nr:helix-turn-helix transcriptional regulator [Streptococcus himalayensis]GGE25040.1 transcriptional regulator [Streptococcus himalayensis]
MALSEKYGQTFRYLREARGFSLKEAAGETISPQHLGRFEKGKSMVSLEHFEHLLQNIGIDWSTYLVTSLQFNSDALSRRQAEIYDLVAKRQYTKAIEVINRPLEEDGEPISDYYVVSHRVVTKLGLANRTGNSFLTPKDWQEVEYIKQRLTDIELWGNIEVNVYAQLLPYFSYEFISFKVREILKLLKTNPHINHHQLGESCLSVLKETVTYYSQQAYYQEAEDLIQQCLELFETVPRTGVNMWLNLDLFILRSHNFLRQNDPQGLEIAQKVMSVLNHLEELGIGGRLIPLREDFFQTTVKLNQTGIPFNP